MALNIQTFKTRALTAIIFVIVMLGLLLYNHWTFFLLFTIIHFGCWIEFQQLMKRIDVNYAETNPIIEYGVMILGFGFMLMHTNKAYLLLNFHLHDTAPYVIGFAGLVLIITSLLTYQSSNNKAIYHSIFGLLYISFSWSLMISLRNKGMVFKGNTLAIDFGWIIPMVLIAAIWINDTMAYIVGSFIGKTPLSAISPKKTWEGTIGGAILAIVTVTVVGNWVLEILNLKTLLIISTCAAIIGTLGDLLESKLKRLANVKDSGSFMPGHGGFLDRFDSLLLATPVVYFLLKLID
ncbi:MAG: phosphatidate cytidylyltransferase [Chitinophagaceae bacterium]